ERTDLLPFFASGAILPRPRERDAPERNPGRSPTLERHEIEHEARRGAVPVAVGCMRIEKVEPEKERPIAVAIEPALGASADLRRAIRRQPSARERARPPELR